MVWLGFGLWFSFLPISHPSTRCPHFLPFSLSHIHSLDSLNLFSPVITLSMSCLLHKLDSGITTSLLLHVFFSGTFFFWHHVWVIGKLAKWKNGVQISKGKWKLSRFWWWGEKWKKGGREREKESEVLNGFITASTVFIFRGIRENTKQEALKMCSL